MIVVAYFDRLVRSSDGASVRSLERVEAAGGAILAVPTPGEVRADTASRWLSSTMHGDGGRVPPAHDPRAHG